MYCSNSYCLSSLIFSQKTYAFTILFSVMYFFILLKTAESIFG
ncbi:hypothetical protein [Campylobacter sp.]|nr:hypothetical protein [Campylobacter sp.]